MRPIEHRVEDDGERPVRLDVYLAKLLDVSRSQIKARTTSVHVNGSPSRLSKLLVAGDLVRMEMAPEQSSELVAEEIELDVLYEDSSCIVLNKPRGMVVHPAAGHRTGTLVHGLLHHFGTTRVEFGETQRPGIVHRLDKETTGAMIAAKNVAAQEFLARQFKDRTVRKTYLAIVRGRPNPTAYEIVARIGRDPIRRKRFRVVREGGKRAVTRYRTLWSNLKYSFLALEPLTGRTHQLRVHLRSIGAPIIGDPLYSRPDARLSGSPLLLHSFGLTIALPESERESRFFAPLPAEFKSALFELVR